MKAIRLVSVLALAGCISGCAAFGGLYGKRVDTVQGPAIGTNTVLHTNLVSVPVSTNADGSITSVTKAVVTPSIEIVYAPPTYVTNLVENATVTTGIDIVKSLPFPFAGVVGLILGGAYSAYASIKNKKVSVALVKGIETGRQILQETPEGQKLDERFRKAIIEHQSMAGVLPAVSKLVNDYTDTTKG